MKRYVVLFVLLVVPSIVFAALSSDGSGAVDVPLVEDNLVAGQVYTIKELGTNVIRVKRTFFVDAYFIYYEKEHCPPCPENAFCALCRASLAVFSDEKESPVSRGDALKTKDVLLFYGDRADQLQLGKKYRLTVQAYNFSKTNVPQNGLSAVRVDDMVY